MSRYCRTCESKIEEHRPKATVYCRPLCRPSSAKAFDRDKRGKSCGSLGAASELIVSADLLLKGYDVYRSVSPNSASDIVAAIGNVTCLVEVKTGIRLKNGTIQFPKPQPRPYDVIAVYVPEENRIEYRPDIDRWFESRDLLPEQSQRTVRARGLAERPPEHQNHHTAKESETTCAPSAHATEGQI